jgi:uncharacterized protein
MRFWDSSALVPLLVSEPDTVRRAAALRSDPVQAVWWGTQIECESALQRRLREGVLDATAIRQARTRLTALAVAWSEVPPTAAVRTLAIRLLRTHALRAADAQQLAGLPDLDFLTADTRLADAAEIEGLTVGR